MTTDIKLTDTQRQVLEHAVHQTSGRVTWFPENIKGGARKKVLDGLFNRALITSDGTDCHRGKPVQRLHPRRQGIRTAGERTH